MKLSKKLTFKNPLMEECSYHSEICFRVFSLEHDSILLKNVSMILHIQDLLKLFN